MTTSPPPSSSPSRSESRPPSRPEPRPAPSRMIVDPKTTRAMGWNPLNREQSDSTLKKIQGKYGDKVVPLRQGPNGERQEIQMNRAQKERFKRLLDEQRASGVPQRERLSEEELQRVVKATVPDDPEHPENLPTMLTDDPRMQQLVTAGGGNFMSSQDLVNDPELEIGQQDQTRFEQGMQDRMARQAREKYKQDRNRGIGLGIATFLTGGLAYGAYLGYQGGKESINNYRDKRARKRMEHQHGLLRQMGRQPTTQHDFHNQRSMEHPGAYLPPGVQRTPARMGSPVRRIGEPSEGGEPIGPGSHGSGVGMGRHGGGEGMHSPMPYQPDMFQQMQMQAMMMQQQMMLMMQQMQMMMAQMQMTGRAPATPGTTPPGPTTPGTTPTPPTVSGRARPAPARRFPTVTPAPRDLPPERGTVRGLVDEVNSSETEEPSGGVLGQIKKIGKLKERQERGRDIS